jgi:hypothetical protein
MIDGGRRPLEGDAVRIRLQQQAAMPGVELELVPLALLRGRDEGIPDAAGPEVAHGMLAAVPAVEVPDHADPPAVGGPDTEVHACDAVDGDGVRAELVVDAGVVAFAEQVQVIVRDDPAAPGGHRAASHVALSDSAGWSPGPYSEVTPAV